MTTLIDTGIQQTLDAIHRLRDAGLGGTSYGEALTVLYLYEQDEPRALSDLARAVGLSRAAFTTLADRLSSTKLATRVLDEEDRRRWLFALTTKGRAKIEKALA